MSAHYRLVSREPLHVVATVWPVKARTVIVGSLLVAVLINLAFFVADVGHEFLLILGGVVGAGVGAAAGLTDGHAAVFLPAVRSVRVVGRPEEREVDVDGRRFPAEAVPWVQVVQDVSVDPNSGSHTYYIVVVPLGTRAVRLAAGEKRAALDMAEAICHALGLDWVETEPQPEGCASLVPPFIVVPLACAAAAVPLLNLELAWSGGATWATIAGTAVALYGLGRWLTRRGAATNLSALGRKEGQSRAHDCSHA